MLHMNAERIWQVVAEPDREDATRPGPIKVRFVWTGGLVEEFTLDQLKATIGVLGMQGKRRAEYDEALAGLIAMQVKPGSSRNRFARARVRQS
jgi:hypothetical protein